MLLSSEISKEIGKIFCHAKCPVEKAYAEAVRIALPALLLVSEVTGLIVFLSALYVKAMQTAMAKFASCALSGLQP